MYQLSCTLSYNFLLKTFSSCISDEKVNNTLNQIINWMKLTNEVVSLGLRMHSSSPMTLMRRKTMMRSLMVIIQLRRILVMFMLIWKVSDFTITCLRNYPCWCYRRDISNITFSNSAFYVGFTKHQTLSE